MPLSIRFFKEEVKFRFSGKDTLIKWIKSTIRREGKKCGTINFIFCSDQYLLTLNKDYLNHNFFTDIITFDYCEGSQLSGDIYISIDRVKDNSNSLGLPFSRELHRVIIHGVLHLAGYKDSSAIQKKLMRRKEDACLSLLSSST